jgi:hypothetical protein
VLRFLLLAIGIAMVLVALAWRARDLRRRSDGVASALRSSDAETRTRALREIAAVGLRPWVAMLLERTTEVAADGAEADELVWLIGACQWEPADDPAIVRLRLWAARRLEGVSLAPIAEPEPDLVVTPAAPPVDVFVEAAPEEVAPEQVAFEEVAPVEVAPVEVAPVEVTHGVDVPVAAARPAVVEEIEGIVGSRVLAVTFAPLARSGS